MQFDIRRFDIYRKVPKDLTQPTLTGALISIIGVLFIIFLMTTEFLSFLQTEIVSEIFVDDASAGKIPVNINVTFQNLECDVLGLDIQDQNGRHEVGYHENTKKIALKDNLGCRFEGTFHINRVPGNFHLSMHSAKRMPDKPDMSHFIHSISFGNKTIGNGAFEALSQINKTESNALSTHDYILKVVPTAIHRLNGTVQNTFQYSYAHKEYMSYGHGRQIMPAIWFRYDLSAITIKYTEKRQPFYHFITTFCAIVGGTFTVTGIIDGMIFTAHEIFKKAEIGKLS